MVVSYVANIFDSSSAYIYVWISKSHGVVYVGQTSGDGGVIGRAAAHVRVRGTLRERFFCSLGVLLEDAKDWYIISFPLPKEKKYTGAESSYRNAVEYLVQTKLNEIRGGMKPPFRIISNICYSDHCSDPRVIKLANNVVEWLIENYPTIQYSD